MKANSLQQVAILLLLSAAFPVKVYCLDASSQWQSTIEAGNKTESSGKFDEAEKSYRSAISMAEKFPQPDIRLALSLNNLAMLCVSRAKNDQAESLYKRAISILNKVSSPPEVLPYKMKCLSGCLGGLGAVYAQQAKYELAISTFKQAIERSQKNH